MIADRHIRRVVIAGGGTAGWMTAAALSTVLRRELCSIELIESEAIGTVGVGEATIPAIHDFHRKVGLDEADFMKHTGATFKLGIEFVDWARPGDAYIHPFGPFGYDMNGVAFHHYWLAMRGQGDATPFGAYCLPAAAAKLGRFALPDRDPRSLLARYYYAFHLDANLYARYLRRLAERRGVRRTEGRITGVALRGDSGHIESLKLEDDRVVAADLFIDCTGFRALLIGERLGVPHTSWQQWLPCDRAIAVPSANPDRLAPYTRATARPAGWQWRIPLQHRTGNGHVYSSEWMSDDEATGRLLGNLECAATGEPRLLRFVAGRRERMWTGNCVAIGLSGGFLEPLESTSIYLIQAAILKLIERFPDRGFSSVDIADFNEQLGLQFDRIRDFVVLHYKANERGGKGFWDYCRNMRVPDTLEYRMRTFRERGHVVYSPRELFIETNWVAVFLGQSLFPAGIDPRVRCMPTAQLGEQMQRIREAIRHGAESLPRHEATLRAYCPAEAQTAGGGLPPGEQA